VTSASTCSSPRVGDDLHAALPAAGEKERARTSGSGEASRGEGEREDALLDPVPAEHRERAPLRPDEALAARQDLAVEHGRVPLAEALDRALVLVVDDVPPERGELGVQGRAGRLVGRCDDGVVGGRDGEGAQGRLAREGGGRGREVEAGLKLSAHVGDGRDVARERRVRVAVEGLEVASSAAGGSSTRGGEGRVSSWGSRQHERRRERGTHTCTEM